MIVWSYLNTPWYVKQIRDLTTPCEQPGAGERGPDSDRLPAGVRPRQVGQRLHRRDLSENLGSAAFRRRYSAGYVVSRIRTGPGGGGLRNGGDHRSAPGGKHPLRGRPVHPSADSQFLGRSTDIFCDDHQRAPEPGTGRICGAAGPGIQAGWARGYRFEHRTRRDA